MSRRLALVPLWLLAGLTSLACKPSDPGSDTSASTGASFTAGDETFGMGVTSDPTRPPEPTTTESTVTADPSLPTVPTGPTSDVTTDPTAPPTITADPSSDPSGTESASESDPTFPLDLPPDNSETTFDPNCPDPPNQPHSADCTDASGCGCASGRCFLVPILGGFCSECLVDADCGAGGCTVPDVLNSVGAVCNMGEEGAGCMSDDVCNDPSASHCATIVEVPGIITVATCGECTTNADCPAQLPNCTPAYDIGHLTGVTFCAADGSVPNNSGCNLEDDGMGNPVGNKACQTGHCGDAVVMGLLHVGICGACNQNSDCMPNETCSDPVVDLEMGTLIGAICQ